MNITPSQYTRNGVDYSQSIEDVASSSSAGTAGLSNDPAATKQMFLQLLVSQIQNQNPLNPADPSEFVAQLSQFTGVEQMLAMRQHLEAIHHLLAGTVPAE